MNRTTHHLHSQPAPEGDGVSWVSEGDGVSWVSEGDGVSWVCAVSGRTRTGRKLGLVPMQGQRRGRTHISTRALQEVRAA